MNTETGQIYPPGETEQMRAEIARKRFEELTATEREFAEADAAGRIVPVSDRVAKLMTSAHRADRDRKRKRKAATKARKRNR